MAVGQDNLERDLHLARIYAAAGSEEPPAEFDAAIRAAARRAVGAGPAVAGVPPRARRNWHVPVSLAAVLVLSVSLVTLVREEKGSDLSQAPAPAASVPAPAAPPLAQAPGAQPQGVEAATMKDATAPAAVGPQRDDAVKSAQTPAANGVKERTEQREKAVAAPLRKSEAADVVAREGVPRSEPAAPPAAAVGSVSSAPVAPAIRQEAELARDGASTEVPRPLPAPAPVAKAAPAPNETKLATPMIEGRVEDRSRAPERPALRSARRDAPAAAPGSPNRPAWLAELDHQPAERWLERLAEFRREGRQAEADLLLAEFRKRFPDHPASR